MTKSVENGNITLDGFPMLWDDELVYSGEARFYDWADYDNLCKARHDFLGRKEATTHVLMPSSIGFLQSRLPAGLRYTSKYLIARHTLFPFTTAFMPSKFRNKLYRVMLTSRPFSKQLGDRRREPVRFLRICPDCAAEDIELVGEPYAHRSHQIACLNVCYKHGTFLVELPIATATQLKFISVKTVLPKIPAPTYLTPSNSDHRILLKLANDAYWLLTHFNGNALPDLRRRYLRAAIKTGLAYENRIKVVRIFDRSTQMLTPSLLAQLGVGFSIRSTITEYLLKPTKTPPSTLHHLVLLYVLEASLTEFFSDSFNPSEPVQSFLTGEATDQVGESPMHNLRRSEHEQIWLNLRQKYPQKGVMELKLIEPSTYYFLRNRDKQWFNQNKPPRKPLRRSQEEFSRIDLETCPKIVCAGEAMLQRAKWITIEGLCREAGFSPDFWQAYVRHEAALL